MKCVYLDLKTKTYPDNCQHCKASRLETIRELAEKMVEKDCYIATAGFTPILEDIEEALLELLEESDEETT